MFVSQIGVGLGFVWSLFVKVCNKIAMRVTGHSALLNESELFESYKRSSAVNFCNQIVSLVPVRLYCTEAADFLVAALW